MEQITANHPLSKSVDIIKENVDILKSLFPNIIKEGKVDVEELKALLGEEIETNDEYYRFTWAGKSQARQEANKPSTGTLRPIKKESKDWNTTQNILIEGDNLEVLKLLQKSYVDKIKMIYIDPPYNTGKDFVYKDNYADNLGNYLSITGQTDEEGKKLSTNTESDGRYHSNWLNMMYPRLKLARQLLNDDGVIFISINENEVHNLRKLCDEIFGEENFVCEFVWQSKKGGGSDNTGAVTDHEYVLSYSKTNSSNTLSKILLSSEELDREDEKGKYRRGRELNKWGSNSRREDRPTMYFPVAGPNGENVYPIRNDGSEGCWRWGKIKMEKIVADGDAEFVPRNDGTYIVYEKIRSTDPRVKPYRTWLKDVPTTAEGSKEVKAIFDGKNIFSFPKPLGLCTTLLNIGLNDEESIILDFFAGSGTTAHAVMQLNSEDGGTRKYICVQLPEATDVESEAFKYGYKTIAEITKERIRRAGAQLKVGVDENLFKSKENNFDIGFRLFKLDSSNINAWDGSVQDFEQNLLSAAENIKPDRAEEDVLYEILLKSGLDLAQPIEEKTIAGKKVFNIGLGALFICLANDLTTAVAEGIGKWKQELEPSTCRVIFKDTGFNDVEKTNSIQILKRYGINEVNTI